LKFAHHPRKEHFAYFFVFCFPSSSVIVFPLLVIIKNGLLGVCRQRIGCSGQPYASSTSTVVPQNEQAQRILETADPRDFSKCLADASTSSHLKSAVNSLPRDENCVQRVQMSTSPLSKIVFIQKVALFAGSTPKKALQLIYVSSEWRETVVDFTFDALFFDPFVKPLLQQTPTTSSNEKEKEMQQQSEQKKLELFQQFRKVISFFFKRVSAENKELEVRMKTLLAVLFDLVHRKDNNNNSNDDVSSRVTNDGYNQEVASFLRVDSLRSFLGIEQVHDLIVNHIAPHVTAIDKFGMVICNIVQDRLSAELFSNVESFGAILKCFHRSRNSTDAYLIAGSIINILNFNPSSNKLFNSLPVVEAFSFIIPLAYYDDPVEWISLALVKILDDNEEAQRKFGTPEFLEIFQRMENYVTSMRSDESFRKGIELLMQK
jgi:hypothetical protein